MEQLKDNPFLKVEDPYEAQNLINKKVEEEAIEFQRLCFEIFIKNKDGEKILAALKTRFLYPRMFDPSAPNAGSLAVFWEGFKDVIRSLEGNANLHLERVNRGNK